MKPIPNPTLSVLIAIVALIVAACGAGATASSIVPSPSVGGPVTTEAEAVARVLATEPRLAGISKRDPDLIGQSSWYEVAPASGVGAFVVTARVGWGDCPAGCIDEHTWVYAIGPDGTVTLQSEGGGVVPPDAWPSPAAGASGGTGISGTGMLITAVAGPICPVEQIPPDPACAPRAVPDATIVVLDGLGTTVAKGVTGPNGVLSLELSPGDYVVEGLAVEGLMGAPERQNAVVVDGSMTPVALGYDTGIR